MTPRRRWPRRVAVTAAALAIGLAGLALTMSALAWRELAHALAATTAADPRWTLAAIEADRPPLADDRDGFVALGELAGYRPSRRLELLTSGLSELTPGEPVSALQRTVLANWSDDFAQTRTALCRLADTPQGGRRIDVRQPPDDLGLDAWLSLTALHRGCKPLWMDLTARVARGDRDGALQTWRAAWNGGRVIGTGPHAAYVRLGFRGNAHLMLERALAHAGGPTIDSRSCKPNWPPRAETTGNSSPTFAA